MGVVKLRTRRAVQAEGGIARLREAVLEAADGGAPAEVVDRLVHLLDRELSSRRGWRFVMVEPHLHDRVVGYLTEHSRRPLKAVRLWSKLFTVLPPDSNEVLVGRAELARMVGCQPRDVSEIMGELEAIGAVERKRDGRAVRYFVNPRLGTHLAGAARDRAQAEAPDLKLIEGGRT
jgi:CRP-like cAMP-binding protein